MKNNMKTIISDIRKEFCKKKIDWNQMEARVKSLGEKINFYDENFEESRIFIGPIWFLP